MPPVAQSPAQIVLGASVQHRQGEVRLLLLTAAGTQVFAVANELAKQLGTDLRGHAYEVHGNAGKSSIKPEKLARLEAALADYRSGKCRTQQAAAQAHGIPYGTFIGWLSNQR